MTGKADYLELGDWNAQCYECGRKFKASQLIRHWQGYYVCKDHWEPRQPQDFVRAVPDQQTPPWVQPMPTDTFGTARLSTNGTTAGNSGIVSSTLYIVDIPWAASGTTITDFDLTDYITPPSSWGSGAGSSTAGQGAGTGATDGTGWGTVLINIPNGTVITGSFSFGTGWPAADANGNGGTEFLVNNNGDVRITPTFPANINVTRDGVTYNNPVDKPSYTLDWRFGQFPPPRLLFTVQPTDTSPNTAISPAMQVTVVNNVYPTALDTLIFTVGLEIGVNPGDPIGTLSGTLSAVTSAGIATFSAVQIDEPGDGYTLNAGIEGTNIADVASTEFNVSGDKATGGTVTTSGAYTIHTFETSGTFEVLIAPLEVDYLIVAGGGARWQGGGGAGGLSYVTGYSIADTGPITVTVGAGGGPGGAGALNGEDTTFITTVAGGGRGGDTAESGATGGCGGGGGWGAVGGTTSGGVGSVGYNGGGGSTDADEYSSNGGGGGGMGAAGTDGVSPFGAPGTAGNGGDGVQNSISGVATWYAGGGAGSTAGGADGTNGQGRDGPGGGGTDTPSYLDANDGIVIIRYLT